jgi:hypothetical protein
LQKKASNEQKLLAEKSGILSWLIEGAWRWKQAGLNVPAIITNAADEYRGGDGPYRELYQGAVYPETRGGDSGAGTVSRGLTAEGIHDVRIYLWESLLKIAII